MDAALQRVEQLPNLRKVVAEALNVLERQHALTLAANSQSQERFHQGCQETREIFRSLLAEGDLDWEQRKYILDLLMRLLQMEGGKDTENKGFLSSLSGQVVLGGVVLTAVAAVIIKPEVVGRVGNALRRS